MRDFSDIESAFEGGASFADFRGTPVPSSTFNPPLPQMQPQTQHTDIQAMIDEAVRRKFKRKRNNLERKIVERMEAKYEDWLHDETKKLKKKYKKKGKKKKGKKSKNNTGDLGHMFANVAITQGLPRIIDNLMR